MVMNQAMIIIIQILMIKMIQIAVHKSQVQVILPQLSLKKILKNLKKTQMMSLMNIKTKLQEILENLLQNVSHQLNLKRTVLQLK